MCISVERALGALLTSASLPEVPAGCNGVPTMHGKLCGTVSPANPHFTYCTVTVEVQRSACHVVHQDSAVVTLEYVPRFHYHRLPSNVRPPLQIVELASIPSWFYIPR